MENTINCGSVREWASQPGRAEHQLFCQSPVTDVAHQRVIMATDDTHFGFYVRLEDVRNTLMAVRCRNKFSVKAIRDQNINMLQSMMNRGQDWASVPAGTYIDVMTGPIADTVSRIIAALDFKEKYPNSVTASSYNDRSVTYSRGLQEILATLAQPLAAAKLPLAFLSNLEQCRSISS